MDWRSEADDENQDIIRFAGRKTFVLFSAPWGRRLGQGNVLHTAVAVNRATILLSGDIVASLKGQERGNPSAAASTPRVWCRLLLVLDCSIADGWVRFPVRRLTHPPGKSPILVTLRISEELGSQLHCAWSNRRTLQSAAPWEKRGPGNDRKTAAGNGWVNRGACICSIIRWERFWNLTSFALSPQQLCSVLPTLASL